MRSGHPSPLMSDTMRSPQPSPDKRGIPMIGPWDRPPSERPKYRKIPPPSSKEAVSSARSWMPSRFRSPVAIAAVPGGQNEATPASDVDLASPPSEFVPANDSDPAICRQQPAPTQL